MATPLIPIAFRIRNFRSIMDSGRCSLSGDKITVLAGQNEAGKTAVLMALRDFDLEDGKQPVTPEYLPEGKHDAESDVAVLFRVDVDALSAARDESDSLLPDAFVDHLRKRPDLWITRRLRTGTFHLEEGLKEFWAGVSGADVKPVLDEAAEVTDDEEVSEKADEDDEADTAAEGSTAQSVVPQTVSFEDVGGELRRHWPLFVYFASFNDILPREVAFQDLIVPPKNAAQKVVEVKLRKEAPQPVKDFIKLSGLDLKTVSDLSAQDKGLRNYLNGRGASITGDFLNYWKQAADARETVNLGVGHVRDNQGLLKLAFFVRDGDVEQYPEQRSQGFLWFLSFYLRLAAAEGNTDTMDELLLIDEPGPYLHARAQRDVLHLFEDRVVRKQQIIYSTHSPFLLPADKLHRVRVVLKTVPEGTRVLERLTDPILRGHEFNDTLSPIIAAIGLDIREAFSIVKPKNLLVEGISDHLYLHAWVRKFRPGFLDGIGVFPGTGATSLLTFTGLFIGWGLPFAVLLDRDKKGEEVKGKLLKEYALPEGMVLQPRDATAIEDLFSAEDFRGLLSIAVPGSTATPGETPTAIIKRLKLDKVLLARAVSEEVSKGTFQPTRKTQEAVSRLLDQISVALAS